LSRHPPPVDVPEVRRSCHHLPAAAAIVAITGAVAACLGVATPATAQDPPRRIGLVPGSIEARTPDPAVPGDVRRLDLNAVEARTADRGPLDASLRWVQPGLELPSGYRQVYRLRGGGFMRADGGLAATFDQSVYQATKWGDVAVIPASTVFVIGGVPLGIEPGHGRLLAVDPLDPGAVPPPFAATATPDDARPPTATPGDRRRRFGFGAGYRMPDRVDPEGHEGGVDTSGSRFLRDDRYRAARLASRLESWRARQGAASTVSPSPRADSTTDASPTPGAEASPSDSAP